MASIARSMAFSQALRPLSRQPAVFQMLRRQSPLAQSTRIAAFHNSSRKSALLPTPPQTIQGTVNDPVAVHDPHPTHGSYHWSFERLMSVGLVPLTLAPFIGGSLSPLTDSILCATLLLHSHIGFDACITDYFPKHRVPGLHTFLQWVLRGATLLAGWGLYEFETNDVGVTAAVAKIWSS